MTIIHTQWIDGQAIIPKAEFEQLLELARKNGAVIVEERDVVNEIPTMSAAEQGAAFEFWNEPGEDIYSKADGEPL